MMRVAMHRLHPPRLLTGPYVYKQLDVAHNEILINGTRWRGAR